jgi:hypothetical protein
LKGIGVWFGGQKGGVTVRRPIAAIVGVFVVTLSVSGVALAQSATQVTGAIQTVNCKAHMIVLNATDAVNVFVLPVATQASASVNGSPIDICQLQRHVGKMATVSIAATGSQWVAKHVDVLGPGAHAPRERGADPSGRRTAAYHGSPAGAHADPPASDSALLMAPGVGPVAGYHVANYGTWTSRAPVPPSAQPYWAWTFPSPVVPWPTPTYLLGAPYYGGYGCLGPYSPYYGVSCYYGAPFYYGAYPGYFPGCANFGFGPAFNCWGGRVVIPRFHRRR